MKLDAPNWAINNTYCHDNELNWFDWSLTEQNADLVRYTSHLIAFRHAHPVLRSRDHFQNTDYVGSGYADISWHGTQAWNAGWSGNSKELAFMLCGKHAKGGSVEDDYIYVAMNSYWEGLWFELPQPPEGMQWHIFANTGMESPEDIFTPGQEPALEDQRNFLLGPRSTVILVGR